MLVPVSNIIKECLIHENPDRKNNKHRITNDKYLLTGHTDSSDNNNRELKSKTEMVDSGGN